MMITIGIDPHKKSHTAVAVDAEENEVARTRVLAGTNQLAELYGFAAQFAESGFSALVGLPRPIETSRTRLPWLRSGIRD